MLTLFRNRDRITLDVFGAADFARIPQGLFLAQTTSGKETVGCKSALGLTWETRHVLSRDEHERLPLVRLHLGLSTEGIATVAGRTLVDTTRNEWTGDVEYDGQ